MRVERFPNSLYFRGSGIHTRMYRPRRKANAKNVRDGMEVEGGVNDPRRLPSTYDNSVLRPAISTLENEVVLVRI